MNTLAALDELRDIFNAGLHQNAHKDNMCIPMSQNDVYVIGGNRYGSLSVNSEIAVYNIQKVDLFSGKNINRIRCGQYYTFFVDQNHHYYACGCNFDGELTLLVNESTVPEAKRVNYFQQKDIKIGKICVNVGGGGSFWISDDNKHVYACGANVFTQLGRDVPDISTPKEAIPKLVSALVDKNITDAKCGYRFGLALSSPNIDMLLKKYLHKKIPEGIIELIVLFHGFHSVYSTGNDTTGGCGQGEFTLNRWMPIETFINKRIIKIQCGARHSLFLESNGVLWASGEHNRGQLGFGQLGGSVCFSPKEIQYFSENNIKIVDIKCGLFHNLAIDKCGIMYAWGGNTYGQCGDGTLKDIKEPKIIPFEKGSEIQTIECGAFHSHVETVKGQHFLFGNNHYNQCLLFNDEKTVKRPFGINTVLAKYGLRIRSVSLGYDETYLLTKKVN